MRSFPGRSSARTGAVHPAREGAGRRGWWHSHGDAIPEQFDVFIGPEEAASEIDWNESGLVPGLFQTEDYARLVMRPPARRPRRGGGRGRVALFVRPG